MPILSTACINDDSDSTGSVEYFKHHGVAKHGENGPNSKFLRFDDVYFMKLLMPKNLRDKPQGFVGLGQA